MERTSKYKRDMLNRKIFHLIGADNQFAIHDKQIIELEEKLKQSEQNILRLQTLASLDEERKFICNDAQLHMQGEMKERELYEYTMPPLPPTLQSKYGNEFLKKENTIPINIVADRVKGVRNSQSTNLFWENRETKRRNSPQKSLSKKNNVNTLHQKENKTSTSPDAAVEEEFAVDYAQNAYEDTCDAYVKEPTNAAAPPPTPVECVARTCNVTTSAPSSILPDTKISPRKSESQKLAGYVFDDFVIPAPSISAFPLQGNLKDTDLVSSEYSDINVQRLKSEPSDFLTIPQYPPQVHVDPSILAEADNVMNNVVAKMIKEVSVTRGFKNILTGVRIQDKIASNALSTCVKDLQDMQRRMDNIRNIDIHEMIQDDSKKPQGTARSEVNVSRNKEIKIKETNPKSTRSAKSVSTELIWNNGKGSDNKKVKVNRRKLTTAISAKRAQRMQETMQKTKINLVNIYGKSRLEPTFMCKLSEPPRWKL